MQRLVLCALIGFSATLAACGSNAPTSKEPSGLKDLSPQAVKAADDFLWLEEINGEKALTWVKAQNEKTKAVLEADPHYETFRKEALEILTASDRTPTPRFLGGGIANFWQDQDHVRGIWRQTSLASYRTARPEWQTLLDVDALAKAEDANWIYKGASCLVPSETRCLISLSDGGEDAVTVREFDTTAKRFVTNGFTIPRGKHGISWLDRDTLLVATEFGAGSLTESGYPFIVKRLSRGQTLAQATEVYRGDARDGGYGVDSFVMHDKAGKVLAVIIQRPLDTYRSEYYEVVDGRPLRLQLPEKLELRGALPGRPVRLVVEVAEPWTLGSVKAAAGSLMAIPIDWLRVGGEPPSDVRASHVTVFAPGPRQSIDAVSVFDDRIVAALYDNVKGQAVVFVENGDAGWSPTVLPAPESVAVHLGAANRASRQIFYSYEGFLTPSTLALADVALAKSSVVRSSPSRFDGSTHVVEQYEAASSDGTKIPYFVARPKNAPLDGTTPTMMFGYGGFQVSYPPSYKPELGKLWLERGGAYVVANIRGGGEFGPAWHQAALKVNRQRAFDDFAAVAADLAARKIASAQHLGIYGRSNGGVLTSVTLTQHPELIGAAVIESPLVDMLRYHELPPGASWMGEYGDPRIPDEAAFIAKYSAYQAAKPGVAYPDVYITTNLRDDRVHPGHARKFAARLQAMGHPALYFENIEGGHSNDSDPILNAARWARHYVYLARQLGLK